MITPTTQVILLLGPSGAGKSESYPLVESKFPNVMFTHLDGLASEFAHEKGWISQADVHVLRRFCKNDEQFLSIGLQAIESLRCKSHERHLCINVGAGFQDATFARRLSGMYPTIGIVPRVEIAFQRWRSRPGNTGDQAFYAGREFSQNRRVIFDRCLHKIDNSDITKEETASQLERFLDKILLAV